MTAQRNLLELLTKLREANAPLVERAVISRTLDALDSKFKVQRANQWGPSGK